VRAAFGILLPLLLALVLSPETTLAQPTPADVYVEQAVLEFDEKRYDEALENLRRALQVEPDHREALYYTGVVHMARGRPEEAISFLERALAKAPDNVPIVFQLGLAHFARQDFDRAQPLLERAFRADPTLDGLGYYVGYLRYRRKDHRGALNAFRGGRVSNPQLQQLTRLYTGLALAGAGLPTQATAELQAAARLAPASPVTGSVERLRDTIVAARQQERRLAVELRLGAFYDDNVAVVPERDRSVLTTRLLRGAKHESTGELLGARIDHVWLREGAFDATVGYSFFGTYNNELPSFNVTDHLGTLGSSYRTALGAMPLQLSSQYAFDILFLDDDEFVRRHSVTLAGAAVESDRHLTQVYGRYQRKDFNEEPPRPDQRDIRDGNNYMGGFLHLLRFAQDRHFIKAGYQVDYEDTEGANFEYLGHRVLLGGQYTLPWAGIRLKYDFDVHIREYSSINTVAELTGQSSKKRQDEEVTNILRIEVPLPAGFTVSGEYQSSINQSNVAVFDYTRNVVSMSVSWTY
jgi:tetratricopeptide (TPR) repeat protein